MSPKKSKRTKKSNKSLECFSIGSFVSIPSGTFQMGSPESEISRYSDETQHLVTLTKSFEMQTTQVTQKQWTEVMGNNPSYFKGDNLPVEQVSWNDCQEFIQKLNSANDGYAYRLPTEAEWEYCCRAGAASAYSFGDDTDQTGDYAWYYKNSDNKTHEVAQLKPNAFGLYDMHGNVWEWCQDWYGEYNSKPITDPVGPSSGSHRVLRGGSWYNDPQYLRSAQRSYYRPDFRYSFIGFRLVRTSCDSLHSYPLTLKRTEAAKHAKVLYKITQIKTILQEIEKMMRIV